MRNGTRCSRFDCAREAKRAGEMARRELSRLLDRCNACVLALPVEERPAWAARTRGAVGAAYSRSYFGGRK